MRIFLSQRVLSEVLFKGTFCESDIAFVENPQQYFRQKCQVLEANSSAFEKAIPEGRIMFKEFGDRNVIRKLEIWLSQQGFPNWRWDSREMDYSPQNAHDLMRFSERFDDHELFV